MNVIRGKENDIINKVGIARLAVLFTNNSINYYISTINLLK